MTISRFSVALFLLTIASSASTLMADGPADNQAASVRPVPPPGIAVDDEVRSNLKKELSTLQSQISELRKQKDAITQRYLPDVEIFARAVDLALNEDGFFEPKDAERAKQVLQEGFTSRSTETWSNTSARPSWLFSNGAGVSFQTRRNGATLWCRYAKNQRRQQNSSCRHLVPRACRKRSRAAIHRDSMTNSDPAPEPGTIMIHPFRSLLQRK